MSISCNFQRQVSAADKKSALDQQRCEECSISAAELADRGETLEVCGVEHFSDLSTGKQLLIAIPLCPECHQKFHLTSGFGHDPCQTSARRSWEQLGQKGRLPGTDRDDPSTGRPPGHRAFR